jgi:succinate dehydrogenase/fumarate reductase flavoprotein subunit
MAEYSRRGFLALAGIGAATVTGAGLAGCSASAPTGAAAKNPGHLPESWDVEADIVIVGHGGAGAAAAITCTDEGLGDIFVMDAAPSGQDGGNTKVSANLMMIPDDVEGTVVYQTALNSYHAVEEDLIRAWAKNLCGNKDWLEGLGITIKPSTAYSPEFPEIKGSEYCKTYFVDGVYAKNSLWNALVAQEEALGVSISFDTRALKLYRDPLTNEVQGVYAEKGGKALNVKARKGVILSCGGFENNEAMLRSYLGTGQSKHPLGTPFNRGDGFGMVAPFGAQLWHMNNAAGTMIATAGMGLDAPNATSTGFGYAALPLHSYVFVGADGRRFMYEETAGNTRHGKKLEGGVYADLPVPEGAWAVFDQTFFDNMPIASPVETKIGWASNVDGFVATDNKGYMEAGVIVGGDTPEALAKAIGVPPSALAKTLESYNSNAADGVDPEYHRGETVYGSVAPMGSHEEAESGEQPIAVKPFALAPINPPYYATPIRGCIYNTQGGPKRNGEGQVLDYEDQPIPRLYAAGEFGAIYSYMYNGGGNVSDAIASGRAAARHAGALTPWDEA